MLSLLQVAAPDLAFIGVSPHRRRPCPPLRGDGAVSLLVARAGRRRGLAIWAAMALTFTWDLGWRTLALLPVALRRHGPLGGSAVLVALPGVRMPDQ